MPSWNADLYLRFAEERTRPCHELATRVAIDSPRRVIDLGCGPGNSTQALAERWPEADLAGIDSSADMIAAARKAYLSRHWLCGDIASWTNTDEGPFDVVFSNAALQWVPDHAVIYPKLLNRVAPGGALAAQVPSNFAAPAHRLMRQLATSPAWRERFPAEGVREWHVHEPAFYYDVLAPHAARIDLWETEYIIVLPSAEAIVDWYKGTGLRPFLDALPSEDDKKRFAAEYLELIRTAYPCRADGQVLFPFKRLFLIAYR